MALGLDLDTESAQRSSIPSGGAGSLSGGAFTNCFAGVWVYRPSATATFALTDGGAFIHYQSGAREVYLGFNSTGVTLADLNLRIIFNSAGGEATFTEYRGDSFLDEWVYYFIAENPTDGQIAGYIRLSDLTTAVTKTRANDNGGSQYVNTLTFGNFSANNTVILGHYAYARARDSAATTADAKTYAASSVAEAGDWGFWPLLDNADTGDDSGNGRDLTFNGTLTTQTSPTFPTKVPRYANTPRDDELIALGSVLGPYSWVKPQSWF